MVLKGKMRKIKDLESSIDQFNHDLLKYQNLNQERVNKLIATIDEYIEKGRSSKEYNKLGKAIEYYSIALRKINNLNFYYELSIRGEAEDYGAKYKIVISVICISILATLVGTIFLLILSDFVYGVPLPLNPITITTIIITIGGALLFVITFIILLVSNHKMRKKIQSSKIDYFNG